MQWVQSADDKFCIAILADFLGGSAGSTLGESVTWVPTRATPDSVLKLAGFRPRIHASSQPGGAGTEVVFDSVQSFDPGEIFQNLPLFAPLREAREAAKSGKPVPDQQREDPPKAPEPQSTPGPGLLDAILDVSQPTLEEPKPGTPEEIEAFVRDVVRPHLVRDDTDAKTRVATVDEDASDQMSAFLHDPAFQRLESIWRSVVFLLSHIDTAGKVRVHLVHVPKRDLQEDLMGRAGSERSQLQDLLSSPQLGAPGRRWGLVLGAYPFSLGADDITLLGQIAKVAQEADVPWISGIVPSGVFQDSPGQEMIGHMLSSLPEEWGKLRERPEAAWLGLTYPRFLLREPFGDPSRRTRVFDFRETVESAEDLLWGDGSFLAAALLAQGIAIEGWGMRPENHLDLGGMPVGNIPGGTGVLPSSLERGPDPGEARALAENGIIPLIEFPERAGIRLGGIRSVADSGGSLAGWWRR